ncbi:MAG TPA: hypothetical protein VJ909_05305 [Prolixibacteraceae bacterium]|nr:hypothetical protein [Prolixibacteraceae bacterium]
MENKKYNDKAKQGIDKQKSNVEEINRKEALGKMGKYAAFTAVGMLTVLSPKQSQAASEAPTNPYW